MEKIIVSVESTADLDKKQADKYGISVINMEYGVGDKLYVMNSGEQTLKEFYDLMREGATTRTSQINEYGAYEYLLGFVKAGQAVVHLAFSSTLSGTYQSFCSARDRLLSEYPSAKIAVIDSLCACAGQGIYSTEVALFAQNHTFEEVVAYAEELKHRIVHLFVVDDLKYLARGGRISKSTALIGNAIHMKPVMHMNKGGYLVPFKKVLSRKKSILTLAELTSQNISKDSRVYIAHADCLAEAQMLIQHLSKNVNAEIELFDLGPIIGSHSGPGTIAIFFIGERMA